MQLRFWDAHPGVLQPERGEEVFLEVLVDGKAGDTPDDFAEDEAEVDDVVGGLGAGRVDGFGAGEIAGDEVPEWPEQDLAVEVGGGDAGLVGEDVADGGGLFAAVGELGPVGGDGGIQVDFALFEEVEDGAGGEGFGDGEG